MEATLTNIVRVVMGLFVALVAVFIFGRALEHGRMSALILEIILFALALIIASALLNQLLPGLIPNISF